MIIMENSKNNLRDKQENNLEGKEKGKKSGSGDAAKLGAISQSATDAARSHRHTDTLSNTGTNISYEGNTAPGAGGSVGTGQASGQDAVEPRISSDHPNDYISTKEHTEEKEGEDVVRPKKHNDDLDRETLGTP
jgi:hypothetical protein